MIEPRPSAATEEQLRRAEEALRRSQQEFRDLIERMPDLITIRRGDRFVYVNSAGANALGYARPEELVGRNVYEVIHPDDRALVAERVRLVETTGVSPAGMEVRYLRPDGGTVLLELAPTQIVQFEGEPGYLVTARDVTERKKLQAQSALADRMVSLGILSAGVAHEINNPLSCVMGNLDYLAEGLDDLRREETSQRVREMEDAIRDAREAADRVRRIVLDLAAFSRSESEGWGATDLRPVLESSINMAWHEIRTRARLIKEYGDVPLVDANETQIGQVFLNLLVNAAQSIAPGAADRNEIRVITRTDEGGNLVLEIRDTGSGLAAEERAHLFDPFFTSRGGSGLGLAICHGIVTGHGGYVQVESEVGEGSLFRVVLPPAGGRGENVTETLE